MPTDDRQGARVRGEGYERALLLAVLKKRERERERERERGATLVRSPGGKKERERERESELVFQAFLQPQIR